MIFESPLPFLFLPMRQRPKTSKTVGHAVPLLLEQEGATCQTYLTTGTRMNFHHLPVRAGNTRTALSLCPTNREEHFLTKLVEALVTHGGKGVPTFTKGSILAPAARVAEMKERFPGWPVFPYGNTVIFLAEPAVVGAYTRIGDYLSVQVWDPSKNVIVES